MGLMLPSPSWTVESTYPIRPSQNLACKTLNHFLGQADFANPLCDTDLSRKVTYTNGIQYDDYCFTDFNYSKDTYGHGSHVAGIIWSNLGDWDTFAYMGVAPQANILSVRVLGDNGMGTYEDIIQGIQYIVANKEIFNIRVLNVSLSAKVTTPYFVDPLNRAVEAAWAEGIVVVAAAGNTGAGAQTITVPGNDPYVITVGALDGKRTPGYWGDDVLAQWSATGPTLDGFVKPDVLAPGMNIVSFMHNDHDNIDNSAYLVRQHPDYTETSTLFRMNGTSMATAITSGVVAMMLDADPDLTPDQVKYRLMSTARPAVTSDGSLLYNVFQQGMGRIYPTDAILSSDIPLEATANAGMDIQVRYGPWMGRRWRRDTGS